MHRGSVIFCLLCLSLACGCAPAHEDKHPAQRTMSKSDYQALREEFSGSSAGKLQHHAYPIKQGNPPLAVLVPANNAVRVVDATTGVLLASGTTDRDAIVAVDAKAGITLGREELAAGPIPSAQPVAIYIETIAMPGPVGPRSSARPATLPSR
jgi:hypothetical protein